MTANELLAGLITHIEEQVPGLEPRLGWEAKGESRLVRTAVVTGEVVKEAYAGEGWEAKLAFTLFLPRERGPESAGDAVLKVMRAALGFDPAPAGVERGALSVDKHTGALTVSVTVAFKLGGGASSQGGSCSVKLNGQAFTASGCKVSVGETGGKLVAIGEEEPFASSLVRTYTIDLQGLPQEALALPDGFSFRLAGREEVYENCRWKSRSAAGAGTLVSEKMTKGD